MGDTILIILSIIIGTIIFILINKIFKIYYFGFKGIASTWITCAIVAYIILLMMGESLAPKQKEVQNEEIPTNLEMYATASSTYKGDTKYDYSPNSILNESIGDGGWVEGVEGQGIGEYLVILFNKKIKIKKVIINNGLQFSENSYNRNSRIKDLKIIFDKKNYQNIILDDIKENQTFDIKYNKIIDSIKLQIQSVYPGDRYQDTGLSRIQVVY